MPIVKRIRWSEIGRRAGTILTSPGALTVLLGTYAVFLGLEGFVWARGLADNDWPLNMWLAKAGCEGDLSALAIGHQGIAQLLLPRLLLPVFGSTLTVAKVTNIVATVVAGYACFATATLTTKSRPIGLLAAIAFMLSFETYFTGWSEFGDPFALAFFAVGTWLLLSSKSKTNVLVAGLVIGAAGLVRLHYQTFSWALVIAYLGFEVARTRQWTSSLERVACLSLGTVVAQLPLFAINLIVHGELFTPIASYLVGSAVLGANEYDIAGTIFNHPNRELLTENPLALLELLESHLVGMPGVYVLFLSAGLLAILWRRRDNVYVAFFWLLAVGYFVGFVMPSFGLTPRLLLPFVYFSSLSLATGIALFVRDRETPIQAVVVGLAMLGLVLHFRAERSALRHVRNDVRRVWDRNTAITQFLRERGVRSPLEVFASDWFVYPTDDPELIGFYNFGFWNGLIEANQRERPNPYSSVGDALAFGALMKARNVRFLVLHDDPRLPGIRALALQHTTTPDYHFVRSIEGQAVFEVTEGKQ